MIRDFIPVIDGNNVACLYEQVEGKLYYNKGTGTFTAGNTTGQPVSIGDKARKIVKGYVGVPASYTPVEYIGNSGAQYIDTNYSLNSNAKIEMKVDFTNNNRQECIFCGRDFNSGGTGINNFTVFKFANSLYRMDYNSVGTNFSHSVSASTPYIYVMDKNNLYENNTLIRTETAATFTTTNSLFLMAARNGNAAVNNWMQGKLYYCKIWDGDTLVRNFIPVKDQDNIPCLYDLVEGKFYYNKGTGTFTAGNTTGQPVSLGSRARLFFIGQNQTPPNTFMLCHFDGNCYDEITKATIPTGFGVNYIAGKFSQAAHRTNTNQTQFTNSRLPKLEDVFAGTAAPFTITYWSNGSGDFWYRNTSQVYVSSRETSYLGIKVSQITNPSVRS